MSDCTRRSCSVFPITAFRRSWVFVLLTMGLLVAASGVVSPADAQIQIGFCQGPPGGIVTVTVKFIICCPPLGTISNVSAMASAPCDDPTAVMSAISAAIAGIMFAGDPVFDTPVAVPSPVAGQARYEYPLSAAFAASGCCVVGGGVSFDCGTFSLRINPLDCAKLGDPPDGSKMVLCCETPTPPPAPVTLAIVFEGCPPVFVGLPPGLSCDEVADAIVAALTVAGFSAFKNAEGKVEVHEDCTGELPTGIDEFGLAGGISMGLGVVVCPPPGIPVPVERDTWGGIKHKYQGK